MVESYFKVVVVGLDVRGIETPRRNPVPLSRRVATFAPLDRAEAFALSRQFGKRGRVVQVDPDGETRTLG